MMNFKLKSGFIILVSMLFIGGACGGDSSKESPKESSEKSAAAASAPAAPSVEIDLCRCMSEPGNSEFSKKNEKVCDTAISKKLEVPDWKKANLSDANFNRNWKALEKECGSNKTECIEKEKKARGCTSKTVKDPAWESQNCTQALMAALGACE